MIQTHAKTGSRVVKTHNQTTDRSYESVLFVNHGEDATTTRANHKTLKGAIKWANKVLGNQ